MNGVSPISRKAWLALGVSTVLCGLALGWPKFVESATSPAAQDEVAARMAERDSLAENTDAMRDHLRTRRQLMTEHAWTPEMLDDFAASVGPEWKWQWEDGQLRQRAVLLREAPKLQDWFALLALIESFETRPGLAIEVIDIEAEGSRRARRYTRMSIGLRFLRRDASIRDAERPGPSPGPLPVAGGTGAATTRKIGPGRSLGRPTASAKPPAPGPASAPVQPDPPGSRAAAFPPTSQKNQPINP